MSMVRGSVWDPSLLALMPHGIFGGCVNVETSLIKPPVEGAEAESMRLKRKEVRERRGEERKEKEGRASKGKREGTGKRRQRRKSVEGTGKTRLTVQPAYGRGRTARLEHRGSGRAKENGSWGWLAARVRVGDR